ncbi:MAG: hypothetical protein ABR971_07030, partial [Acidobacteriaceae bacterium]
MPELARTLKRTPPDCKRNPHSSRGARIICCTWAAVALVYGGSTTSAHAQQSSTAPVVQPGAPGTPSRTLPSSTTGVVPLNSRADIEFMQGMIMHHAQAVEMTALIQS